MGALEELNSTVFLRFVTAQRGEALAMTSFSELVRGSLDKYRILKNNSSIACLTVVAGTVAAAVTLVPCSLALF